jgi:hypothetical protein
MTRSTYSRKRTPSSSDENEGPGWRLIAALVAIPIFEISLFLGMYLVYPSRGMGYVFLSIPLWVHGIYVGAAAVVGLLFGFKGIVWLLGHLFFTHHEDERNRLVTGLLWGALAGLAFVASYFVA